MRGVVRCGARGPTPYLRSKADLLIGSRRPGDLSLLDIGCGNGRNVNWLVDCKGPFKSVLALDRDPPSDRPYFKAFEMGPRPLPVPSRSVDVILANYSLMFLEACDLDRMMVEIRRVSRLGSSLMVEMYPAKRCPWPGGRVGECWGRAGAFLTGWGVLHESKLRMTAVRTA